MLHYQPPLGQQVTSPVVSHVSSSVRSPEPHKGSHFSFSSGLQFVSDFVVVMQKLYT